MTIGSPRTPSTPTATTVTRLAMDTDAEGLVMVVTIRRHPALMNYTVTAQASDIPQDVRSALKEWLESAD